MNVKDALHAAASFAFIFVLGLGVGWVWSPGPIVTATMDNSTVNMTPDYGSDATAGSYPCVSTLGDSAVRCTFVGDETTWVCTSDLQREYSRPTERHESCREVA